jgi:hypothetical protein
MTSIDWLSDHGAVLYAVANHALVSGDDAFYQSWSDAIVKGCEFIRDSRAIKSPDGITGLMPAAVATDTGTREQAVWNDGWNYKGLSTAARLLKRMKHLRADEFEREAADYRAMSVKALREATPKMPQWTDSSGKKHHLVPTALPSGGDLKFPFYLDTGPLFLVYAGLMDADDELMRSSLAYFREGPNVASYDITGAWHQPISLRHELSSCEPCYSWNVFHAWQSGDRPKYMEGFYSLLCGAVSRQTSVGCEHRGGISGNLFTLPLTLEIARRAVIDDQFELGSVHLLRLVPLAWLRNDQAVNFENLPTELGPVTLRFAVRDAGKRLDVTFEPTWRAKPTRVVLHVPPVEGLRTIRCNGKSYATEGRKRIELETAEP